MAASAALILSASGANWSSTMRRPSGPADTAMLPPWPSSIQTAPATLVGLISTLVQSGVGWGDGVAAGGAAPPGCAATGIASRIEPIRTIDAARTEVSTFALERPVDELDPLGDGDEGGAPALPLLAQA